MLLLDLFLARVDRRESDAHAAEEYSAGSALLASGHPSDASVRFGTAVAIDRRNAGYALALAESMLEEGRTADAEATLKDLLDRAENDGAVNLTMAHVMAREHKTTEAKAYFHRAIFGHWGEDSLARRRQARFELIDVLARQAAPTELLAELLPLEETSPDSTALRQRLGELLLLAGAPRRATVVFRGLLQRNPTDVDALLGLGESNLSLGNFSAARNSLAEAARIQPSDPRIERAVAAIDTALSLDPTARGIGERERNLRSRALLTRTVDAVSACVRPDASVVLDSARTLLAVAPQGAVSGASNELATSLATSLWS
ncbi:MAG TPA: tetratricopeptide repeat protein, partial [Polyangiales bacterium]|nr:tetratricopeptide repeat protein [Polyangiales bacterium]